MEHLKICINISCVTILSLLVVVFTSCNEVKKKVLCQYFSWGGVYGREKDPLSRVRFLVEALISVATLLIVSSLLFSLTLLGKMLLSLYFYIRLCFLTWLL